MLKKLKSTDKNFELEFLDLLGDKVLFSSQVESDVRQILEQIKLHGDKALLEFTNKFDSFKVAKIGDLQVPVSKLKLAYESIDKKFVQAMNFAIERVSDFHKKQCQNSWFYNDVEGNKLGQLLTPIESVGVYVPGGKASYPSSLVMNTIPAQIAGVDKIVMVVPAPNGEVSDYVLATAHILGIKNVYLVGGAQAVGALAYGNTIVPKVDKIVGPGNSYVACAKKQVFGLVAIDMIAGPSEVVIYADDEIDSDWVAMDMFAQAEHDEDAKAIAITNSEQVAENIFKSIEKLLPQQKRKEIISKSLSSRGAIITVANDEQAVELINRLAPEHLELAVKNYETVMQKVKHASSIFLGNYTAEVFGDYCAGPNHVLPTSGTARFYSPLGVYDFQKKSSVLECSQEGAKLLAENASILANIEGLFAHKNSANARK